MHIFIERILLMRQFSFRTFSYAAFSRCVISYDAYLHSANSPTALKEKKGAERK
jgi:hypothetical protein